MADIIDVNIGDQVLEVYWQDEVELNLDMDLMYIKSGQKEIQDYVDNVSKPEINSYIETEAKPIVTEVVNTIAEPIVNEYVETVTKPAIDEYFNEKKPEVEVLVSQAENYASNSQTSAQASASSALAAENALTTLTTTATDNFNANASEKQAQVDASASAAKVSETNSKASETAAKTSETNSKIWAEGSDSEVTALGGVHSSKVWSETAQAVVNGKQDIATAVNYDNITNCITEIPQDIKLELNNGTLTLKAGSKVYVPNGKNIIGGLRFNEVVVESDISLTQSWGVSQTFLLFYSINDSVLRIYDTGRCYSGTTSVSDGAYYNTNDNKLYVYDGGSLSYTASLPIAIITGQSPTITSIDQVFNGFGYIGSTVFALPGVKGLIPNGRNADGSLKNIEFTTQSVLTQTRGVSGENRPLVLRGNDFSNYVTADYNEELNLNIGGTGTNINRAIVGTWSATNSVITSLTPKTAFHAVDWNDLEDKLNHLNNPFFFGMHIWSDTAITNASWLISNGSYQSGATYASFYEWLLKIKNGTLTVDGVSVKAYGASGITDYDYVINTANTTFRLPIKVKLASGNAVAGNGMTLGFDTGVSGYEHVGIRAGDGYQNGAFVNSTDAYGKSVGETAGSGIATGKVAGVTTDPTKSGIETSSSGLKLYFYVGETIQDANVINAAGVLTRVANSIDRTVASDRETVVGWGMPDYSAGVSKNWNTNITAENYGVVIANAGANQSATLKATVNGNQLPYDEIANSGHLSISFVVSKGDVYKVYDANGTGTIVFYPCKGVK